MQKFYSLASDVFFARPRVPVENNYSTWISSDAIEWRDVIVSRRSDVIVVAYWCVAGVCMEETFNGLPLIRQWIDKLSLDKKNRTEEKWTKDFLLKSGRNMHQSV